MTEQNAGADEGARTKKPDPGARLLSDASARDVPKGSVVIVSRQPGLRRAAHVHPGVAVYPAGKFKAAEMAMLKAEPLLEVIEIL